MKGTRLEVGVCPQFSLMWDQISTEEHLAIFGKMKGLQHGFLEYTKEYYLQKMQLDAFRHTRAANLSGGNKRKLNVALALIGASNIAFFDEPSTGVDPMSRRFLFNALKQMKDTSAMLTTHAMEEAEYLCHRVGVLVDGEFVRVASPHELKQ